MSITWMKTLMHSLEYHRKLESVINEKCNAILKVQITRSAVNEINAKAVARLKQLELDIIKLQRTPLPFPAIFCVAAKQGCIDFAGMRI